MTNVNTKSWPLNSRFRCHVLLVAGSVINRKTSYPVNILYIANILVIYLIDVLYLQHAIRGFSFTLLHWFNTEACGNTTRLLLPETPDDQITVSSFRRPRDPTLVGYRLHSSDRYEGQLGMSRGCWHADINDQNQFIQVLCLTYFSWCIIRVWQLIKVIRTTSQYSELGSTGSVMILTNRVFLKRKFGETKLHYLFNNKILLTMIKFRNSFKLKIPVFSVSNCMR